MVRVARGLVVAVVLAVLMAGCGSDTSTFSGHRFDQPYTVPDVSLTDTDGQPFSLTSSTNDPLTVVFFGYTRCADICPLVLGSLASAMTRLDAADRARVQVVFITSDPTHDTPSLMRSYLDRFDSSFVGLGGTFKTVDAAAVPLHVGLDKINAGGHTTTTLAVTSADQAVAYWDDGTSPAQFAADFHTLLDQDS